MVIMPNILMLIMIIIVVVFMTIMKMVFMMMIVHNLTSRLISLYSLKSCQSFYILSVNWSMR